MRYANEHGDVDALSLKHLVYVTVIPMDGIREPHYRAALSFQFGLYHFAYMYAVSIFDHKRIVNFVLSVPEVLDYLYNK